MSDVKARDVVLTRHPFLPTQPFRVAQVFPSVYQDQLLYRIQLLTELGEDHPHIRPIVVTKDFIRENLGGYTEWVETLKKN